MKLTVATITLGLMTKTPNVTKVTLWHSLRDIFVASINKGQFPVAILGLVLCIYCLRVAPEVLTEHGREFIKALREGYLVGYVLFAGVTGVWYIHAKKLRRKHHDELNRIAKEKTDLQQKLLGPKVKSSKKQ